MQIKRVLRLCTSLVEKNTNSFIIRLFAFSLLANQNNYIKLNITNTFIKISFVLGKNLSQKNTEMFGYKKLIL